MSPLADLSMLAVHKMSLVQALSQLFSEDCWAVDGV